MVESVSAKLVSNIINNVANKSTDGVSTNKLGSDVSPFQQVMDQMSTGSNSADQGEALAKAFGVVPEDAASSANDKVISAEGLEIDPSDINLAQEPLSGSDKVVNMLSDVNKGQMKMDELVNQILYSGKHYSSQELLAIQAEVFHYAQMSELTVKVADQGVSSVKSVLSTQIS